MDLGSAGNFAVLAKTAIVNVPPSIITGDLGTSPITGAAITGLTCAEVKGTIYSVDATGPVCRVTNPALLAAAVSDMEDAYTNSAKITPPDYINIGGGVIGGMRFAPGLYKFTTAVSIPTDLTLVGGANDVWTFQIPGALNVAAGQHVWLTGGAQAKNVFWVVGGATTLGANSDFSGTILDKTAMTIGAGAALHGRALAPTALTMSGNTVTIPVTIPVTVITTVPATSAVPVTSAPVTTKSVNPATTNVVIVYSPPVANFMFTPSSGAGPLGVTFTATSTSAVPITSRVWDFGDGTTSIVQPVHTYSLPGLYTVKLTVTDGKGVSNTRSITNAISASVNTPPVADFVSAPATGTPSTEQNPVHTYISPGLYTVSLTVTDSYGASATKSVTNAVSVSPPPTAAFTVSPSAGSAPLDVVFSDTSLFAIPLVNWVWDFGDGSTSTQQNPVHTFMAAGAYPIHLTITDENGMIGKSW